MQVKMTCNSLKKIEVKDGILQSWSTVNLLSICTDIDSIYKMENWVHEHEFRCTK